MLPVLDIGPFLADRSSAQAQLFVSDLRDACHGPGFVYIKGHGIAPEVDDALLSEASKFFALPALQREQLAIVNSPAFRGYTVLGDERTNGQADWRDQLDLGDEQVAPPPELSRRGSAFGGPTSGQPSYQPWPRRP